MSRYEVRPCGEPPGEKYCVFFGNTLVQEFDDQGQAAAEAVRLQASWDDMEKHAKEKEAILVKGADEAGHYVGLIHHADEFHALQGLGIKKEFVIHRQTVLPASLSIGQVPEIKYRAGRASVAFRTGTELGG